MWQKYIFFLPGLFLVMLFWGCQTVTVDSDGQVIPKNVMTKEERTKSDIELLVDALAIPNNLKINKICEKLIKYKESAIPELSRNIDNRIPSVRLFSIYCLGQIYTKTKSKAILQLKDQLYQRLSDRLMRIRLEAAAALCAIQDYRGVPILIEGLRSRSSYVRMNAYQVLRQTFTLVFSYHYYEKNEKIREKSVKQWENWWEKNKGKYLNKTVHA